MELEGSLKTFSLPEILQFLAMSKMTGTLAVSTGSRTIRVMILDGKIVNTSTLNLSRKLGTLLINHNLLQRHQLDEALQRQKATGNLLGQILVDEKFIAQEDLDRTIKMQLEEEVWDLFRLSEGDFKFEHGDSGNHGDVIVEIEIEPLIMEGSRQLDEWNRIIKNIPGDEFIVTLTPIEGEFEKLPLTDMEWIVLSYINGRSSIGSIVNRSTIGKFETYQALNSFLAAGMVSMKSLEELQAEQSASEDPEDFVIPMGGGPSALLAEEESDDNSPNLMNKYFKADSDEDQSQFAGKYIFMSPVGQMAEYITRYMDALWKSTDFQPGPEDGAFLELKWRDLLNEFYRADLVTVANNRLNAASFERFVGFFGGVAASLRSSFEDSIGAMEVLIVSLEKFTSERMGAEAVNAFRDPLMREFEEKSVVRFTPDESYEFTKLVKR